MSGEESDKFEKGNAELLALQRLDESCIQLQKQGNYLEALECMERGLVLRQHFFGTESEEVWSACKTVGELCNLLAMTYLQQEDYNMVLELLKKAEILTERDPPSRAATFNNLACYYRRKGKLHSALQYLEKALKIESKLEHVQNPADTHINACAVLSQLGRHPQALEHAQSALILLQEELLTPPGGQSTNDDPKPPQADRIAVLAIAYHNCGVEQEFLKRYDQSMMNYKKGFEVAERYLGAKHPICNTLKNSYNAAKKAAKQAMAKQQEKNASTADSTANSANKNSKTLNNTSEAPSPSSSSGLFPEINPKAKKSAGLAETSSPYLGIKNSNANKNSRDKKASSQTLSPSSSAMKLKELQLTSPYAADH